MCRSLLSYVLSALSLMVSLTSPVIWQGDGVSPIWSFKPCLLSHCSVVVLNSLRISKSSTAENVTKDQFMALCPHVWSLWCQFCYKFVQAFKRTTLWMATCSSTFVNMLSVCACARKTKWMLLWRKCCVRRSLLEFGINIVQRHRDVWSVLSQKNVLSVPAVLGTRRCSTQTFRHRLL